MKKILLIFFLAFASQVSANDVKPDSTVRHLMQKGVDMLLIEEYDRANGYFMQCLNLGTILPDELAFHFGKSLYKSNYPNQSEMFLEKYVQLKDSTAMYYAEALALLEALRAVPDIPKEENEITYSKTPHEHEDDPCEGYDDVVCPICNGAGVIKKNGKFGPIFRTCKYCDDHGLMPCEDYIKYREGTLYDE